MTDNILPEEIIMANQVISNILSGRVDPHGNPVGGKPLRFHNMKEITIRLDGEDRGVSFSYSPDLTEKELIEVYTTIREIVLSEQRPLSHPKTLKTSSGGQDPCPD